MDKPVALSINEPSSNIYRVDIEDGSSKFHKTVSANSPDEAIGRIIDMLTGGLLSPEEFWDKYSIIKIIKE